MTVLEFTSGRSRAKLDMSTSETPTIKSCSLWVKETVGRKRVEHLERGCGQAAPDMVCIMLLTLLILDYSSRPLGIAGPILGVSDLQHVPARARYQSQVEFEFPFS